MALGSTQPLTEMSTRNISCGRCVRLTTLPKSCAVVTKSWNLNLLEPSGPVQACNGTALLLPPAVNPIAVNKYIISYHSRIKALWQTLAVSPNRQQKSAHSVLQELRCNVCSILTNCLQLKNHISLKSGNISVAFTCLVVFVPKG